MRWSRSAVVIGCVVALLGIAPAGPASGAPPADLVVTDRGPVRGTVADGVRRFQGIPYAAPPVGALRWQAPRPARPWRDPLDATAPRANCAQPASGYGTPGSLVEDCLYLNVTTPARRGKRLPVMVWIHGGSFLTGGGAGYDAARFATEGDVVVVSVNYRLGALGFLALPDLTGERPGVQSGNYGIADQRAALGWVRRNAAVFGGDPGNVTVFGESAGASSVCAHLASPASAGLFHRAIAQSFSCAAPLRTAPVAESAGLAYAAELGCADPGRVAACLRAVPTADLLRAWPGGGPVAGGREQPVQPAEGVRRTRVPLLLGNTLDEMRLFVGLRFDAVGQPVTAASYEQIVTATYGAAAPEVLARYPVTAYPTPSVALATVQTHAGGPLATCDHLAAYRLATARPGAQRVYAYQFVDRTAPALVDVPGFDEGAAHAAELPFLFPRVFGGPLTAAQDALAATMVRYWSAFAHRGDPNTRGLPHWPRFSTSADVLALGPGDGGVRTADVAAPSNCAFWAGLGTAR